MRLNFTLSLLLVLHLAPIAKTAELEVCETEARAQAGKVGLSILKKKDGKLENAQVRDILRFEEGPFQKTKQGEVLFIFDVGAKGQKGICVEVKLHAENCRVLSSGQGNCAS